ncbi:MAG: replicative DNA helicase [Dehalococcoidia bacterium]
MILEKLPPHDVEAEESVVASLLVDADAIYKVASILEPQDFFLERAAWVYEACRALWQRGEAIDQIAVAHELARRTVRDSNGEERNRLQEVGGMAYLSQLTTNLATPLGVEHYAQIVQRDAIYRELIRAAGQITAMAYQGGADLAAVMSRSESLLLSVRRGEGLRDFVHIRELLERHLEAAEARGAPAAAVSHVTTGFMDLDTLLGGLRRSDLAILAARPSLGKTSLALNVARNAAVKQQAKVAIFSLETAGELLAQRLLSMESGVDSTRLRLGMHTDAEERRVSRALGVLSDTDIFVDDTAVLRVAEMRGKARRLAMERGLDLVIVDYLQLMHGGVAAENRVQEISYISRSLKELARELEVPVLAVSQLSRAVETRSPHIPMLSDLRESGSIEQDADLVLFIYREDKYVSRQEWERLHPSEPARAYPEGMVQVIVAKHRNGPTGTMRLRFREKTARFEDLMVAEEA